MYPSVSSVFAPESSFAAAEETLADRRCLTAMARRILAVMDVDAGVASFVLRRALFADAFDCRLDALDMTTVR